MRSVLGENTWLTGPHLQTDVMGSRSFAATDGAAWVIGHVPELVAPEEGFVARSGDVAVAGGSTGRPGTTRRRPEPVAQWAGGGISLAALLHVTPGVNRPDVPKSAGCGRLDDRSRLHPAVLG